MEVINLVTLSLSEVPLYMELCVVVVHSAAACTPNHTVHKRMCWLLMVVVVLWM